MHHRNHLCIILLFTVVLLGSCGVQDKEPVDYVNPFIGTGGHGHTYPGATVPFGLAQVSPDTRLTGWDGSSGYHYSDSVIFGFSHRHLSGTGILDYGDILFMPTTGGIQYDNGHGKSPEQGYSSRFSHSEEKASPGYYSVRLKDYDIQAELTATERTGMHRYQFPGDAHANVILDLVHRDRVQHSHLEIVNDSTIRGMRVSQSWADSQHVYFYACFSRPFKSAEIQSNGQVTEARQATGKAIKSSFRFDLNGNDLLLKVGISGVDAEGARKNLQQENPGWDFEGIRNQARKNWEEELSRIQVEGGTEVQKTVFYTALYHSFLSPDVYSDVDGRYRGHDGQIHQTDEHRMYTVFSLWDTFRATHPLFTLTQRKRTNEFIKTFLKIYDQGGRLPVWELSAYESDVMIGYHSIPVIADAYAKNIRGYDTKKALKAMKHSANLDHYGLEYYKKYGFIPSDKEGESVSKTLEYAYDDWCIATMAQSMGDQQGYEKFIQRAQYYKNIFDPKTEFMRARVNGGWYEPFDPKEVNFNYTEANAWQYRFFVPQDVQTFVDLTGGEQQFENQLDSLFTVSPKTTGRHQSDITGLIGQYAHGNEPSHHMAYLYNYIGKPWKTQDYVRQIMDNLYRNEPDGLSGNEDCGQMSSWFVFSAMGFYPVTPGAPYYTIGTPLFDQVTLNLENGKTFTILAKGVSKENHYVQKATLNGESYTKSYIQHEDIMKGGNITFQMDDEPGRQFGTADGDLPVAKIDDHPINTTPFIKRGERIFRDQTTVTMGSLTPGVSIHYEWGSSEPGNNSPVYQEPLTVEESSRLTFKSYHPDYDPSPELTSGFNKIPENRSIELLTDYSQQYTAGGETALIDMIRGSENFRTGAWQGYHGKDLKAIVDQGEQMYVNTVGLSCLQDIGSWIFMPEWVSFSVSKDKEDFQRLGRATNEISPKHEGPVLHEFTVSCGRTIRYIKVHAKNTGEIPPWHTGAGEPAWIFADEVVYK